MVLGDGTFILDTVESILYLKTNSMNKKYVLSKIRQLCKCYKLPVKIQRDVSIIYSGYVFNHQLCPAASVEVSVGMIRKGSVYNLIL